MSLTDAEILGLAVPIASSGLVMLAAWLNVRSIVRRRERLKQQRVSAQFADSANDLLVEIEPQSLLRAETGDRSRYFVRVGVLRTLLAHNESAAQPHAAE